jgi:acyl carrier protein
VNGRNFSLMQNKRPAADSAEVLRIINLVRQHKQLPPVAALGDELRLREDLGFESIDLAELTVRLEERFGIDVFDEGVLRTAGELRARLQRPPSGDAH